MTTIRNALLAALVVALAATGAARGEDSRFDPHPIVSPPLRAVRAVTPERLVLPNGAVVFLLEDHTLPVVKGTAYFPASPLQVPADRAGLDQLTGEVMRSGGSATHPGDALDDRLAALGASVQTSLSSELGYGGFRCLAENTAEVLGLFAEVLRRPAFPDDKIELSKVGMRQQIASRNDELFPVLGRVAARAVYGKESPWSRTPEYATVEPIARAECQRLHAQVFVPERMVIAVYGDFRSADLKQRLKAAFGDWKRSGTAAPALPPVAPDQAPRLLFAPKDDVTQTGMIVAHLGFRVDDPDYASMQVYENALGGGFSSRLVNRIRTQRGLAYTAGAANGADYLRPGVFYAYTLTRNDSALTALGLLREEVERSVREPFTDAEFRVARDAVQNTFVFNFEDPSSVLFRAAYYQLNGYPLDFLARYQKALAEVTPASVLEAARRKVRPASLSAVVVGKEAEFEAPLGSLGLPLERVDIAIPPPPSKLAAGAATPEALARGRGWLERAAAAAGGSPAWAAVKGVSIARSLQVSIQGQQLTLTDSTVWVLPDRRLDLQRLPVGEVTQGFDGTSGWMSMMGQVQDQPRMGGAVAEEYERSLYRLFGHAGELEVQALPEPRTVEGVRFDVAVVKSERVRDWMLLFAPDGRLARMEYVGDSPQGGPAQVTEILGDWQPAGALLVPRSLRMDLDGKPFMEARVTSVSLDPVVKDGAFKKPQP